MEPYGYHPSSKNSGVWKHNILTINFILIGDDFGVKYSVKYHALHVKASLEDKYEVITEWE